MVATPTSVGSTTKTDDVIKLLAEQFRALVENACNSPEAAISELEMLSDTERLRLVVEWNGAHTDYFKDKCVHQLFEEQAERMPNSIAVVYEEQQLTYRELNCRASQLARYLQGLGVGPETLIALCVERSLEMIVGLLGVLKAGGAYVALDPALPKDRLAFMVEDTQATVLLTQQGLVEGLPEHGARVVCLDAAWDTIAQQSKTNIISRATVDNLVYVLYTSGSTGRPKGIAVEHRQLLNYLHGILRRLDLPSGASFATISTFAADLGNTAIFLSLCTGGCLHLVSKERASDPAALSKYFTRYSVDCLKIVPSHLAALMDCSDPRTVLPHKRLVLGGEAADWQLIKRVQSLAPECVVLNHYGPTETTVGVITYQVEKGQTDNPSATLPIGRPITNTQIYLLDGNLQPVPIWVPGELYIGGDSVTRG
jgi:amino acid adenylation domain-containing protein